MAFLITPRASVCAQTRTHSIHRTLHITFFKMPQAAACTHTRTLDTHVEVRYVVSPLTLAVQMMLDMLHRPRQQQIQRTHAALNKSVSFHLNDQ